LIMWSLLPASKLFDFVLFVRFICYHCPSRCSHVRMKFISFLSYRYKIYIALISHSNNLNYLGNEISMFKNHRF
jgi:hypothetical protein